MTPLQITLVFLVLGFLIGYMVAWLIAKLKFNQHFIRKDEVDKHYVHRSLYEELQASHQALLEDGLRKDQTRIDLEKNLTALESDMKHLNEKMKQWAEEFELQRKAARTEFENVANKLLQEKAESFTQKNEKKINDLLQPLHQKIREFGQDIKSHFSDEAKDIVSLKKEIENLRDMNTKISHDAQNLAAALKGDSKIQGDWGEFQLELVLEKSGLVRDTHYQVQPSFKDANGHDKRPDFIVNLPEERQLILDSKVSLKSYEAYFNCDEDAKKEKMLKLHVESLRSHIKDLSNKNYPQLYQINSPDYVLMYVPIEPALWSALHIDTKLYLEALDKNIILVTTSTLLAILRTVAFTWQQDRQSKNVQEIARQSGMLYDKFVAFIEDLREIGARLIQAQNAFNSAMNKISDSKKYGDTLVGRAERIRELGAKTTKSLPQELLQLGEEEYGNS